MLASVCSPIFSSCSHPHVFKGTTLYIIEASTSSLVEFGPENEVIDKIPLIKANKYECYSPKDFKVIINRVIELERKGSSSDF